MAVNHGDARETRGGNMNKEIVKGFTIFTLMVALAILTSVVSG
jgi:type II secretory pathway component PulJ